MATGPIDYTFGNVQTPFQALMQGAQMGAQFGQLQAQRQQAEAQATIQRQAARQAEMFQNELQRVLSNPNRRGEDIEAVLAMSPNKDMFERLKFISESRDKRVLDGEKRMYGQLLAALEFDPEQGRAMMDDLIVAQPNPQQRNALQTARRALDISPQKSIETLEVLGTAAFGRDWMNSIADLREARRKQQLFGPELAKIEADAETAKANAIKAGVDAQFAPAVAQAGLTKAQSEAITAASNARFADALNQAGLNERNWNVRNVQNQINVRSRQAQLDEAKVAADVQLTLARIGEIATSLPEQAKKDINTAAVTAGAAKQQAAQFNSLADRIEQAGGGFGVLSRANEFLRTATGSQNYVSQLRQEFTRLRNSAAVQSLPPGPATDRDIALVLEGFPPPTADAAVMASFLRGMAKLQDITSATENARVDWLSQNRGSLGRARSEFKAGDFTARPGETWVDLSQRIAADVANRYAGGGAPGAQIPTVMQPPPAPAFVPAMPQGFRLLPPSGR